MTNSHAEPAPIVTTTRLYVAAALILGLLIGRATAPRVDFQNCAAAASQWLQGR